MSDLSADAPTPDWRPSASWRVLRKRAELLAELRGFFAARGMLEVETPLLSADTVVDRHLEPMQVEFTTGGEKKKFFLQTSPEFHMKRLLAAMVDDPDAPQGIFQVTRAFRDHETGSIHNPEFSMVEWYRLGDDMQAGMQLLGELASQLLGTDGWDLISYEEAFQKYAGVNPHTATAEEVAAAVARFGFEDSPYLEAFYPFIVEPELGRVRPCILYDYPAKDAALAKTRRVTSGGRTYKVAERFELIYRGVELANGYHELLDPKVLRQRIAWENNERKMHRHEVLPAQNRLLEAMESGLPPCSGTALGFDRLVMLATGNETLPPIMSFPIDRA